MMSSPFLLFGKIQHGVARTKKYLVGEVARGTDIEDDNHSSVLTTIINSSVDGRLKREEKIEKSLNEAAALTALVRERSLEKFAAQLCTSLEKSLWIAKKISQVHLHNGTAYHQRYNVTLKTRPLVKSIGNVEMSFL